MAVDTHQQATKRTRTSSSKVRTGCVTCKIRHVKCDEAKPSCKRCTNTGRKCDGYEPPKTLKASMRNMVVFYVAPQQVQRKILPLPRHSELDHYHRYVAPTLSTYFDSPFWNTLILQMSQSEPTIRHAVSAISAIHKDMDSSPLPLPGRPIISSPEVLKESGEAMRSLRTRISADSTSSLVPLVACLLFTCLECMRGSVDDAMTHMMSGFNILSVARADRSQHDRQSNMNQSELDMIEEHIAPFFNRLSLLCVTFGRFTPMVTEDYDMDADFASLDDARRKMYELAYRVVTFIRICSPKAEEGLIDMEDIIEQTKLQRQCDHWWNKLDKFMEMNESRLSSSQRTAADLCRIHARTMSIWLAVSLVADECAVDQYTGDFETVAKLGARIIESYEENRQEKEPQKFCFEMGIVPALYFTAIKCRVPHVRREALSLLHRAPRREGLWNAHIATKVAEMVVFLEEGGALAPDGLPEPMSRIRGVGPSSAQIPTASMMGRQHSTHSIPLMTLSGDQEALPGGTRIRDTYIPDESQLSKVQVTFRAKPWGVDSDWTSWKQDIRL